MKTKQVFALLPLSVSLKWMTLMPLLLVSTHSLGRIVDNGEPAVIDGSTALDNYLVRNSSSLTANGASTTQIRAETGSSLTLTGTTVSASASTIGVDLVDSSATITGSNVTGRSTGLSVGSNITVGQGSKATVTSSNVTGGAVGAVVSGLSQLDLNQTTLVGTSGFGLQLANGQVSANGSTIQGGINGVLLTTDQTVSQPGRLTLNGTTVRGQSGAAIVVNNFSFAATTAEILVGNKSTLIGGNGKALEVKGSSTANMVVDNSDVVGDVSADAGATANITLQNQATLTGRLENVASLAVNSQARWNMVGNASIGNLSMNGGSIQFGSPTEFYKLSVANLSGNGTFLMDADFSTGQVDTLEVTGNATGNHKVVMGSSGADPTGLSSIPVIHIASGDAQFSLLNGPVDLGAFSYDLIQQGNNDWYLNTASRVISPGTQSVLALFNTAPTVWYGELSTLRSRMGEVRMDEGKSGGWVRAYGNKYNVSASSGVAYQQTQQGLSFGADAPLPIGDGRWLAGVFGGYSKSDLDIGRGTNGTVDSYSIGAYTTWLHEGGYYFDGVLKFNHFENESDVQLSDGKKTKGNYDNNGIGASLEFGQHIALTDNYFIEPFSQLSGVIIQGQDYDLDNGLSADGDRTRSLLGKVGATAGRNFNVDGKVVQPYVRAAYVHEFAKNNEVKVNDNAFNNDLSGSRGELGAGLAMSLAEKWHAHVDLDYSNGDKIEQPWGVNFGVRYSW
ncbi:autotransporter outer membrane beta-barrel domain-containing protein [Pseudomonas sp. PCH199]|uniref:autotransporter outer membrane beta-barrel domain-containing protein n=1 Tax=unclassified Pseudomonas TaxID=196821 RepID=UPI000BC72EE4|nr:MULTISPECIES: autotransporter outer membrane beta-barrel domain-containing protein [unclassified Pseudomonas]MCW8274995.1 autotransporter outer membrane beta-barrel domain-containing protein [Pseudomonas sp. PCH199]PAM84674.1 autotransporter outer membrane beta-barrel domain-containing protein [Pseudomonas sp. ERMR1:02]